MSIDSTTVINNIVKSVNEQVDEQINRLNNLSKDDFEQLRQARAKALKEKMEKQAEYLKNDHGQLTELKDDKEFFEIHKKTEKSIFLFANEENVELTKILEHHLKILAAKWIECKFAKIYTKNCLFLADRIKVNSYPSLIIIKDNKMIAKTSKFNNITDIGPESLKALRDLIVSTGVIDEETLSDDKILLPQKKSSIRQGRTSYDDLDLDEDDL